MTENAYIYFMTNKNNRVLYIGITNNLERRVREHKNEVNKDSFTSKYNCHKLVYYEQTNSIRTAIEREKQLKNWKREWKNELIEKQNPMWEDLSIGWEGDCGSSPQ
ncbi:MAG: GIY-YIG nuclease family protein [Lachnospiraceae bacterium]|jgi:putative endonuclease|nr:GIY-YIG nuclease family protein [Lachnospiraceae bacterium]